MLHVRMCVCVCVFGSGGQHFIHKHLCYMCVCLEGGEIFYMQALVLSVSECACKCVSTCMLVCMCVVSVCKFNLVFFLSGEAKTIVCEMVCEMLLFQMLCEMLLFQTAWHC